MKVAENDLTDWYPATVAPARPGVYQVKALEKASDNSRRLYRYYDGVKWYMGTVEGPRTAYLAYKNVRYRIVAQVPRPWRGLKNKPKNAA